MNTTPTLFDRELYLRRIAKASGDAATLLDQRMAEDLAERLSVINRSFIRPLLIAPRPDAITAVLRMSEKLGPITTRLPAGDDLGLAPESHDAVFSLMDLHAVNDVPGVMAQVATSLVPDGLAVFAFFAGDTLKELREAWLVAEPEITGGVSLRVAPMIDLRETGGLLQRAGLALPVADMDRMNLRYSDALALMREVKSLGLVNNLTGRSRFLTSRRLLLRVAEAYYQLHAHVDGRIPATVDIAWAMAWKAHPSQQQPLKPGSAKTRLAAALKVEESKL